MARLEANITDTVDLIAKGISAEFTEELRSRLMALATAEVEAICIAAAKNITGRVEMAHRMADRSLNLYVNFNTGTEAVQVQR